MDSDSRRTRGSAATRNMTAGRASFSMTISSPARTRASNAAKSRSASSSRMWTTAILTMLTGVPHPFRKPAIPIRSPADADHGEHAAGEFLLGAVREIAVIVAAGAVAADGDSARAQACVEQL